MVPVMTLQVGKCGLPVSAGSISSLKVAAEAATRSGPAAVQRLRWFMRLCVCTYMWMRLYIRICICIIHLYMYMFSFEQNDGLHKAPLYLRVNPQGNAAAAPPARGPLRAHPWRPRGLLRPRSRRAAERAYAAHSGGAGGGTRSECPSRHHLYRSGHASIVVRPLAVNAQLSLNGAPSEDPEMS